MNISPVFLSCFSVSMAMSLVGCGAPAESPASSSEAVMESGEGGGAFTCEFEVSNEFQLRLVPPLIERDRMYEAACPGFIRAQVPALISGDTRQPSSRILFDTYDHALRFEHWLMNDFELDGMPYLERPIWAHPRPDCHSWEVLARTELAPPRDSQGMTRAERFTAHSRAALLAHWEGIKEAALARGYTAVWLLYSEPEQLASLVYFAPGTPAALDAMPSISEDQPLSRVLDGIARKTTFDRSGWIISVWYPFVFGDNGQASDWPVTMIHPYRGDGVCEISQRETFATAPEDCLPTCGNGVQDDGEDTRDCPGDVRAFPFE